MVRVDPLEPLLADGVIDEVVGRLKSGKEANIYLVRRAGAVVAAKIYKDRATRSFKNNADYKEGRKTRNSRTQRAIEGGGRFGRAAAEEAWKSAESDALQRLYAHGVRVPEPVMFYEGVLLMQLVLGANGDVAPRLIDVTLDRTAARALYLDLRGQIVAMLCCDIIHGDLSPYNVLAAAAGPTIIDLPQHVSAVHNSRAEYFFQRDFQNVLQFVAAADPSLRNHAGDGRAIWRAYVARELSPGFTPPLGPPPRFDQRRDQRRFDGRPPPPRQDNRPPRPDNRPRPPQGGAARPGPASTGHPKRHRRRPKRRW